MVAMIAGLLMAHGAWAAAASVPGLDRAYLVRPAMSFENVDATQVTVASIRTIAAGMKFHKLVWSPDGRLMAAVGQRHMGLWVADVKTGMVKKLTDEKVFLARLAWCPVGQKLAFLNGEHKLCIADLAKWGEGRAKWRREGRFDDQLFYVFWDFNGRKVYVRHGKSRREAKWGEVADGDAVAETGGEPSCEMRGRVHGAINAITKESLTTGAEVWVKWRGREWRLARFGANPKVEHSPRPHSGRRPRLRPPRRQT